ncbi:SRPBCC family protein [Rhizorhapis suberifaciens]|uniref:Putative membrane protein n=1 Tax=Rhizorhapis suberifaciens TaxID=13656 RepID=A0A840HX41_9SPHN|nr:SRPBCC family protein [Rhizorhapis suberifaciens]MBB4642088.1 putative membrane protein [Rhizorhapis suberifaciens]
MARRTSRSSSGYAKAISLLALGMGTLALGATAARAYNRRRQNAPHDDAPATARRGIGRHFGAQRTVGKTVTVNRPRQELYSFWRNFENLPQFMENIQSVKPSGKDGQSIWTILAPAGGMVEIETEVTDDRENEYIAWRSIPGSEIRTQGHVAFRDAPGRRGTLVQAIVSYKPPVGAAGAVIAAMFRREPEVQARHELKRFKMLMETGEIAHADKHDS